MLFSLKSDGTTCFRRAQVRRGKQLNGASFEVCDVHTLRARVAESVLCSWDRYRCFIYQPFDQGGGKQGFHVVQSGDSTCQGLQSVHVGHKVMNLTNGEWRLRFVVSYMFGAKVMTMVRIN